MKKFLLTFFLLIVCWNIVIAQNFDQDLKKAMDYFEAKNYEDALYLFEKHLEDIFEWKELTENENSLLGFLNVMAICYRETNQPKKVEEYLFYIKQVEEREVNNKTNKSIPEEILQAYETAISYRDKNEYNQAIEYYWIAIEGHEKIIGKDVNYAFLIDELGVLYLRIGEYSKAYTLLKEGLEIREETLGKEHPDYALSLNNLAGLYQTINNYSEAEIFYLEALKIREYTITKNHPDYLNSLNSLGLLYMDMGDYKKAEPLLLEALHIKEKVLGDENIEYTISLSSLGVLYKNMGFYLEAEKFLVRCLQIRKKIVGESIYYSNSLNNLANLYQDIGKYTEAEELLVESLVIKEKILGRNHPDYANSLNNLGTLYYNAGNYAKAELLFLESLEIIESTTGKYHLYYINSLINLATLYIDMGNYKISKELLIESTTIAKQLVGKNHPLYAQSIRSLANLYSTTGNIDEAEPLLLEALDMQFEALKINEEQFSVRYLPPEYVKSLSNLASLLYDLKGEYKLAELFLTSILHIKEKSVGIYHIEYVNALNNLANLQFKAANYKVAEGLFLEALEIQKQVIDEGHPKYGVLFYNTAELYKVMNDYEQAELFFLEAVFNKKQEFKNILPFLSEKERRSYIQKNKFYFGKFILFCVEYYQKSKNRAKKLLIEWLNLQLTTKGIILNNSQQIRNRIYQSGDKELQTKFEEWSIIRREYVSALKLTIEEREKRGLDLDALDNQANELEKEIGRLSEKYAIQFDTKTPTWQEVKTTMPENSIAIEMVRMNYQEERAKSEIETYYAALIFDKSSEYPELVLLESGEDLEKKETLDTYIKSTKLKENFDPNPYQQFWQPIQEKIDEMGTYDRIYFSADGVYNQINLNTLYNPETEKYLIETHNFYQVTNLKDIVKTKKANNTGEYLLFGNPNYIDQKPLNKSAEEINNIASILEKADLPHQEFLAEEANKENLMQVKQAKVLLISAHGSFEAKNTEGNPFLAMLNSGLILSGDTMLTAYEIASGLDLNGTELVILSACESALGELDNGEGVFGLQRSFQQAGAKTVIMSLWKVSDKASKDMMTFFYENLIIKKQDTREAFKNAQLQLKELHLQLDIPPLPPYAWGAFVLVGE